MGAYAVNTGQLQACAELVGELQRKLDSVALRLTGFQLGTSMQLRGSAVLMARIGDCKWAAISQSDDLGRMSQGLADIANLYERCETVLTEPQTREQAHARTENAQEEANFLEEFMEYFPLYEVVGLGVESAGRLIWDLEEAFSQGVGYVMCGIESIFDNLEEFSNELFSAEFLFELVGETAVDIVIGLGIGAALTALVGGTAALAATLGVPAVVAALGISAVGAAICWIGDCICRWATGDDISELVVDIAWDAIEWVGDGVGYVVDVAGEFVSDTIDTIQEGVEALWNSAGDFIGTLLPW